MAKITFLGACSNITEYDDTVSFLVDDTKKILVDVGPTIPKQLLKAGYSPTDIDVIIVTHCHGDHILGFPYLIFSMFMKCNQTKDKKTVEVIATASVISLLKNMLSGCYPPGEFPNISIIWRKIPLETCRLDMDSMKMEFFPVIHAVENIGLRIEMSNKKSFVYSSDTMYCENLILSAKNCDLLIQEAFCEKEMNQVAINAKHSSTIDVNKILGEVDCKEIVLVHYMPMYSKMENRILSEIEGTQNRKISLGKSFDIIEL